MNCKTCIHYSVCEENGFNMTETCKHYDEQKITDEQWSEAYKNLEFFINEYQSIGWSGQFGLVLTLYPLRNRYLGGERTTELYREMMEVE